MKTAWFSAYKSEEKIYLYVPKEFGDDRISLQRKAKSKAHKLTGVKNPQVLEINPQDIPLAARASLLKELDVERNKLVEKILDIIKVLEDRKAEFRYLSETRKALDPQD
jgi:hypothetical protein